MLSILHQFYRFTIPGLIFATLWAVYRFIVKKDEPMGYALFLGLIIIVDNYLNTGIYIPGFEAGSIKYSEVAFFFLYFQFYRKKTTKIDSLVFFLITAYFILILFAAFRSISIKYGIFYFRGYFIIQIMAIMIGFKGLKNTEDYSRFFYYFSILLIFMGLFVLWDKFFDTIYLHSTSLSEPIYWQNRNNERYGSFYLNPNMYGAFIVLVLFNVVTAMFRIKKNYERLIILGGIMLTLMGLVLTHSRGPLISFAVAVATYLLIPNSQFGFKKRIYSLFITILILYIFMPGFFQSATNRFTQEETQSEESLEKVSRVSVWLTTIELINNHPFFGVGLGEAQFRRTVRNETDFLERYGHILDNPHNSYLQIAVESGMINLIVFLTLNAILLKRGIRALVKTNDRQIKVMLSGLLPGMIGYLVSLIFDMSMFTRVAPVYWIMLGFTYALIRETEGKKVPVGYGNKTLKHPHANEKNPVPN